MGLGLGANTATRKIKQRANHAGSNKRHTRVERRRSSSRRTQCGRERRAEDSAGLGSERIQLTRSCAQLLREAVESGPPELRCSSLGCCDVGRRGAVAAWPAHGETRASRKNGAFGGAHSVRSTVDADTAEALEPLRDGLKDEVP